MNFGGYVKSFCVYEHSLFWKLVVAALADLKFGVCENEVVNYWTTKKVALFSLHRPNGLKNVTKRQIKVFLCSYHMRPLLCDLIVTSRPNNYILSSFKVVICFSCIDPDPKQTQKHRGMSLSPIVQVEYFQLRKQTSLWNKFSRVNYSKAKKGFSSNKAYEIFPCFCPYLRALLQFCFVSGRYMSFNRADVTL